MSCRHFLSRAAAAAAGAGALAGAAGCSTTGRPAMARGPRRIGPNDRIQIGLIGAGGQGNWNLDQLLQQPDAAVVAVCDVWKERRDRTLGKCGP